MQAETIPHATHDGRPARSDRELMAATRPFMHESPVRSWWHLVSTFLVLGGFTFVAAAAPSWPIRLAGSVGTDSPS